MARPKKKTQQPFVHKAEEIPRSFPLYGCPYCGGSKIVQAPTAPGYEGKPTFPMPCQHCK